jgi:hypothetical protein
MKNKEKFTEALITRIAKRIGVDISKYDMSEMVKGMMVELEHGSQDEETNVTSDDPEQTFKIMLAHMKELPDYYTRLEKMENEVDTINNNEEKEKKDEINESNRYKELCGLSENKRKKQLTNDYFYENKIKKNKKILKEELDLDNFEIIKFKKNKKTKRDDNSDELYKMKEGE